jgi:diguanylate cyclase
MQAKIPRPQLKVRRSKRAGADVQTGLDLTAALRILKHAGLPGSSQLASDKGHLQTIIDSLCDLCIHDGLTGLVNATFFHAVLMREIDRSSRTGRTCGLLVIDIDHFKNVNDSYGHQVGDMVLREVAKQMVQSLRSMDTAARVGGEEFAVILPECAPEDAVQAAKRLHALLNPLTVRTGDTTLRVTTSAGLVWTIPSIQWSSATLLEQGDQEMYKAKKAGRSRLFHPPLTVTEVSLHERAALAAPRGAKK